MPNGWPRTITSAPAQSTTRRNSSQKIGDQLPIEVALAEATAAVRKVFNDKPGEFDPRKYLGPARDEMKKLYMHKIVNVLGSNGKAE